MIIYQTSTINVREFLINQKRSAFTVYLTGMDGLQVGFYLLFTGLDPLQQVLHCVLVTEEHKETITNSYSSI